MRHVVGLSGGKDSTALTEVEPRDYEYICTPTSDELPSRDTWPASLIDLAKEFDRGRKIRGGTEPKVKFCRVCSL